MTEIAIASGGAALSCLVFAVVAIVLDRPVGWWGWWLLAGLVYGVLLVFVYGPRTPIDSYEPAMPARMVDNSRSDFLYYGITNAVTYAVTTVFVTGLSWAGVLGALVYGLVVGIAVGVTNNAWGRWALLMRLDWQQKLPSPLLPFLEEAHRRRLLRQPGAVYRFWQKPSNATCENSPTTPHDPTSIVEATPDGGPRRPNGLWSLYLPTVHTSNCSTNARSDHTPTPAEVADLGRRVREGDDDRKYPRLQCGGVVAVARHLFGVRGIGPRDGASA
ncbi:hypothetical protein ACWEKT_33100 [Nocardia takedensis]